MGRRSDTYLTLASPASGQFRDRGSRFIALAWPVESEAAVKERLAQLKKQYYDARHHCYAFRLGPEQEFYRYSDDGEPSGTAGRPIYEQILSAGLFNVLIVVVRYFGGVLLGTGGLHNAYKLAARDAVEHAEIMEKIIEKQLIIHFGYKQLNSVMQMIDRAHLTIIDQHFGDSCRMKLRVRKDMTDKVIGLFSSTGKINIEKI
ncbi:MAG: YigZ family protein [Bacteroidales bacterium]|nr:YigZ family protein [Bacteroidales bacterium]